MSIKIKKIQTVIFTKNFLITNDVDKARLFLKISDNSTWDFKLPPSQFPTPNEAPPEFPRFILNGTNIVCNIALSRTDIFYNVPNTNEKSLGDLSELQKKNVSDVFNFLISNSIIINRIGFIVIAEKVLSPEDGHALDYLKNNFVQGGKFQSPKELMFRCNIIGKSTNFEMNNLIIINAKTQDRIDLQTDINTLAEIMNSVEINRNNFEEIIDYGIKKSIDLINGFPSI